MVDARWLCHGAQTAGQSMYLPRLPLTSTWSHGASVGVSLDCVCCLGLAPATA